MVFNQWGLEPPLYCLIPSAFCLLPSAFLFDPEAVLVWADPDRLKQIFGNLLSNAIKFTPVGGQVEVWLTSINSQAQIKVTDTGIGISPEFLPYVFERFRQAESTITRVNGGLGLGLAIVRNLVELHGGTIEVESPGLGQGATFIVQLPLFVGGREEENSAQDLSLRWNALIARTENKYFKS